ncbi:hypothetical protein C7392_11265 [Gilliamella apicola]|nr:hypothetical protein C7392_11265 [Gilliamella apicola]
MLIIFIYYFLSIATLWACYYFRRSRFTEQDYKHKKSLKWRRRILIIWMYLWEYRAAFVLEKIFTVI